MTISNMNYFVNSFSKFEIFFSSFRRVVFYRTRLLEIIFCVFISLTYYKNPTLYETSIRYVTASALV